MGRGRGMDKVYFDMFCDNRNKGLGQGASMNQATLTALRGSIAKWEHVVDGTGEENGARDCTLCQEFDDCEGCPVYEESKDNDDITVRDHDVYFHVIMKAWK